MMEFNDDDIFSYKDMMLVNRDELKSISWLLTLNKTSEALIQLERMFPELKGLRDKIESAGVV